MRKPSDWAIDVTGLVVQGVVVPWLEIGGVCAGLAYVAPEWRGSLPLPAWAAFLLNFVVVDYAYYWNHRLLHGALWRAHAVHHTAERLDVWVTSRNTVWTPVLIVYLWLNAAALFLLADPAPFALAALLTAGLDVWRHSDVYPRRPSAWFEAVGMVLLTPRDHAWHHSRSGFERNFGANLKLWDRLHGTYHESPEAPRELGIALPWSFAQKLLWTGPAA
ncbi:MAG: sterol desaturase family protein [Elusimicrobia bacterium]|nr:sterol desaturase family protein [Elusimicrobiota bacterium]